MPQRAPRRPRAARYDEIRGWHVGVDGTVRQEDTARRSAVPLLRDGVLRTMLANTALIGLAGALVSTSVSLFLAGPVGASPLMTGLFFSARGVLEIISGLTIGALSDRVLNRRTLLVLCPLLCAVGALSYALVRDYLLLLATGAVLFGLGGAGFAQIFAYNRDYAEAHALDPTLLNSVLRSITSLCWIAGPPLGLLLAGTRGFAALYLCAAGMYAVSGLLCGRLLPPVTREGIRGGATREAVARPTRRLLLLVPAVVLVLGVNSAYQIDIALYVTRGLGLSPGFTGLVIGVAAALEVPVIILAGRYAHRVGTWRLVLCAAVLSALFFAALPLARSPMALLLYQVPNALCTGVLLSLPLSLLQDTLPGRAGTASSLFTASQQTGILLAGATVGTVTQWAGYAEVFHVCAALSAVAALLVAAAWRAAGATTAEAARATGDPAGPSEGRGPAARPGRSPGTVDKPVAQD
ncbi:sugar efflux transporter [Streptomyces sp. bgisy091]|uniref:sugar efflux transporter n=1 Tax=Streptomyces sp. bgisy091 TaxID=3413778 RepID=UPI003D74EC4E